MLLCCIFLVLSSRFPSVWTSYSLEDDYSPPSFLEMFDFFNGPDPTNGYVTFVGMSDAYNLGLINTNNNEVYIGVDHSTVSSSPGRYSVRLISKTSYNHGLFVLDLTHMPGGICGTWPAFWLLGPSWPTTGEIDIIENVNSASTNMMTLHTNAGCSVSNNSLCSGDLVSSDCNVNANENQGCSFHTSNVATFGTDFNSGGGGVYVTDWTSESISIWFFPRGSVPEDIQSGIPDRVDWGVALAEFSGSCAIDEHFVNQKIVFDTTFCGDWAGADWATDSTCSVKASTCESYVQNNPDDFIDAYWAIKSLRVYIDSTPETNTSTDTGLTAPTVAKTSSPYSSIDQNITQTTFGSWIGQGTRAPWTMGWKDQ